MKRCPLCNSFASNDATTCFDCLYSFEHMTSLDDERPSTSQEKQPEDVESVKIPIPTRSHVAGEGDDEYSAPRQDADRVTVTNLSHSENQKKQLVITITIESSDAEVVLMHGSRA
jgi:hypothetical protein